MPVGVFRASIVYAIHIALFLSRDGHVKFFFVVNLRARLHCTRQQPYPPFLDCLQPVQLASTTPGKLKMLFVAFLAAAKKEAGRRNCRPVDGAPGSLD